MEDATNIFILIPSIQLVIIVPGIILNLIIFSSFIRRPSLRKKIPSILLFNQSIADLFNSAIYGVTYVVLTMFSIKTSFERSFKVTTYIWSLFMGITLHCSVLLYGVISFERFLSICFPLWHRVHLRKRHIWFSIALVWIVSVIITTPILIGFFLLKGLYMIFIVCYSLMSVVVFIIIILFIITFVKASPSINTQPPQANPGNNMKKQIRLTMVFFIMFMAFTIVYIPLIAIFIDINSSPNARGVRSMIMHSLLLLTSLFNPVLTLCFKREFRPCRRDQGTNFRNAQEMHQMQASN